MNVTDISQLPVVPKVARLRNLSMQQQAKHIFRFSSLGSVLKLGQILHQLQQC